MPDPLSIPFYLSVVVILGGLRLVLLLLAVKIGLRGLAEFLDFDVPFDYSFNRKSGRGMAGELWDWRGAWLE